MTGSHQVDDVIKRQQIVHPLASRHQADEAAPHFRHRLFQNVGDDLVQNGVALCSLLPALDRDKGAHKV